jgi:hypothetical protein
MLALVEVFFTPLHSDVTLVTPLHSAVTSVTLFHITVTGVGVRARIPTSDLSELGFTATRMRCLRGNRCAGLLMFHARVGPLQLRSSSECRRDSPNASLMLRTSGCISYTLKVACRLNVRGGLQQSSPEIRRPRLRRVVGQPTCEAVKVPIVNVHLAITDHPTPKTLGYTLRSHGCLHSSLESLHTNVLLLRT